MPRRTYSKILHRALEISGSRHDLARALSVRPFQLQEWLEGSVEPPQTVFLRAVDIVLAAEQDPALARLIADSLKKSDPAPAE